MKKDNERCHTGNSCSSKQAVKFDVTSAPLKVSLERPVQVSSIAFQIDRARIEDVEHVIDGEAGGKAERDLSLINNVSEVDPMLGVDEQDIVSRLSIEDLSDVTRGPEVSLLLVVEVERHNVVVDGVCGGQCRDNSSGSGGDTLCGVKH